MKTFFTISDLHYEQIRDHLFPGDGNEAVIIALCGRSQFANIRGLVVHDLLPIPYEQCFERSPDYIHWPTAIIKPFLERAVAQNLSIAKIHSHPGGGAFFSEIDTESDLALFDSVYGWVSDAGPHASLVMLPDGSLFGRFVMDDLRFKPIDKIKVSGDDIRIWNRSEADIAFAQSDLRNVQAFGKGTISLLKTLRIGVIGCSGTGSPVLEQLRRLGVGNIFMVDPDKVEAKNLNRILMTKASDIGQYKTDVLKQEMDQYGGDTETLSFPVNLYDSLDLIHLLSTCDILFGCVDSIDGRQLINQIATFYLIPYLDIGVKLVADGQGGIDKICYSVHYLKPGQSLMARKVYTPQMLADASLKRTDPVEFEKRLKEGYVQNAEVESPAVIHINMKVATHAVSELMARLHHYRYDASEDYAIQQWEDVSTSYQRKNDTSHDILLAKFIGRGDMVPLLNMPVLEKPLAT